MATRIDISMNSLLSKEALKNSSFVFENNFRAERDRSFQELNHYRMENKLSKNPSLKDGCRDEGHVYMYPKYWEKSCAMKIEEIFRQNRLQNYLCL